MHRRRMRWQELGLGWGGHQKANQQMADLKDMM